MGRSQAHQAPGPENGDAIGQQQGLGHVVGDQDRGQLEAPVQAADLGEYHEYSVEWIDNDLVFRLDGAEVFRSEDQGDEFPEPLFAILNFAKINDSPMTADCVMEVDWVKHEYRINFSIG